MRARRGARARHPCQATTCTCPARGSPPDSKICWRPVTSTSSTSPPPTICMRPRPSPPAEPASTSCSRSRPAWTKRSSIGIRDAVRSAGVRTIVSFELRYNPLLRFARWMQSSGRAGGAPLRAHAVPLAGDRLVSGWNWVRTRASGRSHLLAAGCHAVDALRWCAGREATEVSAYHAHFTAGYEWPTSIIVNIMLEGQALGHVTSSTDFMMPYAFELELMGDRATLRQDLLQWQDTPVDLEELAGANPFPDVTLEAGADPAGRPAIRIRCAMPDSADVDSPSVPGGNRRARRRASSPVERRPSTCSTPRKPWRSAWRPIARRNSATAPVALPLIGD